MYTNTTGTTSRKVTALKTGGGGDYKPNHNIKMDIKETSEDVM
jgi:hypothetical protein